MIKINLVKDKKEKKRLEKELKAPSVALKVERDKALLYASAGLWLIFVALLVYNFKLSSDIEKVKKEVDELNAQKTSIQAKAKKFLEEKQAIEQSIAALESRIRDVEKGKDILVGLKSYYEPFSQTLFSYANTAPSMSWITSYRQNLDLNNGVISTELDFNSFDYESIGKYTKSLESKSDSVKLSSLERKVNEYGFEYYTVKLTSERKLTGGQENGNPQ